MTESDHVTNPGQKRHRIFYGWWIVGACFLVSLYNAGTVTYGFTAFFEPIAMEFGWSYAAVSFAASIRGMESGLLTPVVGWLVDRVGPRRLMFFGGTATGLGIVMLSRITSLSTFYGAFILISLGTSCCASAVTMTSVANWFRRKISIATGIMSSGVGFGGLMIPLISLLINRFEWRTAMLIVGIGAWCIVLPLSLILRHKPEQYGYLPDGAEMPPDTTAREAIQIRGDETGIGVREALRKRAFWHISLGLMLHMVVILSATTHIMPFLSTIGITRTTASLIASSLPLTSILGRISSGWFGDRYDKRWVTATAFALISLSMLAFNYIFTTSIGIIIPFLILFGLGYGGPVPMTSALLREYFGKSRLGSILGITLGIIWIGGVIGPPLTGWMFDISGSYRYAWLLLAFAAFAATIIMATAPPAGKALQKNR